MEKKELEILQLSTGEFLTLVPVLADGELLSDFIVRVANMKNVAAESFRLATPEQVRIFQTEYPGDVPERFSFGKLHEDGTLPNWVGSEEREPMPPSLFEGDENAFIEGWVGIVELVPARVA